MVARPAELRVPDRQTSSAAVVPAQRIRVLHIVENLDHQAVENWLLRVLRVAARDYPAYHWTFFCVLGKEGRLDEETRRLGAEVIHSRYELGDKRRFLLGLREVMKRGRYDVLHCHHDIMSAAYLAAAAGLPFRKRIVHLHNTSIGLPTPSRIKADLAREPMRQMCLRMADQIVGISKEALESILGSRARNPRRHQVVHYAVDTARFAEIDPDRIEFRRALRLDPASKIILFVGRMVEYKNPHFVLEILEHLRRVGENVAAVFAGAGDQEEKIRVSAREKSLEGRVRLLGFRDDVPELMRSSDILLWPSLEETKEGLGLGIVEAQAAGLPVIMSQSIPAEAIIVPELVNILPLSCGPAAWAKVALDLMSSPHPGFEESVARVESSSFSMAQGVANLMALYV
jgi:glycosyltransferase involved in cell wall biosynthesis